MLKIILYFGTCLKPDLSPVRAMQNSRLNDDLVKFTEILEDF